MPELVVFSDNGIYTIKYSGNPTVSELLFVKGLKISDTCGGTSNCGKCLMLAGDGFLEPDETEKKLIKPGYRLACRARLSDDASVIIGALEKVSSEVEYTRVKKPGEAQPLAGQSGCGAVVDIGTAIIKLAIYDLKTQRKLIEKSCVNPQITVGADEQSRLAASVKGGRAGFANTLCNLVADLTKKACKDAGIRQNRVKYGILTGGTSAMYFINGYDVSGLYRDKDPYIRLFTKHLSINGTEYLFPAPIDRHVGPDMTAAIIGTGILNDGIALICDVGARAKLILKCGRMLYMTISDTLPYEDYISQSDKAFALKQADTEKIKNELELAVKRLLKAAGITYEDIERVYTLGGFASFKDIFPEEFADKRFPSGNAITNGALEMLFDEAVRKKGKIAARSVKTV